jgi:hypothetical protein
MIHTIQILLILIMMVTITIEVEAIPLTTITILMDNHQDINLLPFSKDKVILPYQVDLKHNKWLYIKKSIERNTEKNKHIITSNIMSNNIISNGIIETIDITINQIQEIIIKTAIIKIIKQEIMITIKVMDKILHQSITGMLLATITDD